MNFDSVSRVIGHPMAISNLCEQAKFEAALVTHGVSWVWEFVQENNPGRDNPYHNNRHMMQVALRSLELYTLENIQDPDFEHAPTLLFVAAMLHDFGHSAGMTSDEENIEVAVAALHQIGGTLEKQFYYGAVDHVERIIRVTQFPFVHVPELAEERIIRDADAMSSFCIDGPHQIIESLRSEMQAGKEPISRARMVEMQREFFPQIEYFTETGKKVYELANEAVMTAFEAYADFIENRGALDGNGGVMPASKPMFKNSTAGFEQRTFIPWEGGKQPVPHGTRVVVLLADGESQMGVAEDFYWEHKGESLDIHNYRRLTETELIKLRGRIFIEWNGGAQPVPDGTRVLVQFRNDDVRSGNAEEFDWTQHNIELDIVKYFEVLDEHTYTPWEAGGGDQPIPEGTRVSVRLRNGTYMTGAAEDFGWRHHNIGIDVVAYRVMDIVRELNGVYLDWNGGVQPVPNGTRVLVTTRNGENFTKYAEQLEWQHIDNDGDIVEYCVVGDN